MAGSSKVGSSIDSSMKNKMSYSNKKRKIVDKDASSDIEYTESFDELSDLGNDEFDVKDFSNGDQQEIREESLDENTAEVEPDSDSNEGLDDSDELEAHEKDQEDDDDGNAEGDDEAESESGSDEEIENINAAANEKRTKKKRKVDPEAFSSAMTAILSSHLKAHDRKDPVLVRSKQTAKAIEESKLEAKARRELRLEKKQLLDKERITDVITGVREGETPDPDAVHRNTEHEKLLKKTAKRGVVKLFNTVIEAQKKATAALAV
ncbi:Rrp15p-domain-containing protein [Lipomyces tetrasporus]|uniref:Rrp15p-domain-containing protein n=1 Tax=Lipomyces tetrasporus TaxID=54092 RepID=A0AAD7QUN8_9ASCO|nr:Rrp15p-domain-containing protein [Lipomyces tetrasporus]KAJ8101759.1 Rrp15p-domain-containing protein [Lipomyces tetrasporus]